MKQSNRNTSQSRVQNNNDEEEQVGKSKHEKLILSFMGKSKLEQALTNGLKSAISGDTLQYNPWCEITRAISNTNLKQEIINNQERLARKFKKSLVVPVGKYKIFKLQKQMDEGDKEVAVEKEQVNGDDVGFYIFGLEQLLEYVSYPLLKEFYDAIADIRVDLIKDLPKCTFKLIHSMSGGYLLRSDLIQNAHSHPRDLQLNCECFCKAATYDLGLETFAQFVYEDFISMLNRQDLHIIQEFIICQTDKKSNVQTKVEWNPKGIRQNKNKFIQDIISETRDRSQFYWKGYCRVKAFEMQHLVEPSKEGELFQYIKVYKFYNCHIDISQEKQSFAPLRIGSLLNGVFFNLQDAIQYAALFYKENDDFIQNTNFTQYLKYQLIGVEWRWKKQQIAYCAWEIFCFIFYIDQAETRRNLLDSITVIISSEYSGIQGLAKQIKMLKSQLEYYLEQQDDGIICSIITTYRVLKEQMLTILGQGNNTDIIRFKQYIFHLFEEMEDNQGDFMCELKVTLLLNTLYCVVKQIATGNLQRLSSQQNTLHQFIRDTLIKNGIQVESDDVITFEQYSEMKVPKKMMHVSQEVINEKRNNKLQLKNDQDIEDALIFEYMNYFDVYDQIYYILRDLFFEQQLPNALSATQFRTEQLALKYQLFDLSINDIRDQLCNRLEPRQIFDLKDPNIILYAMVNDQMEETDMRPIWGILQTIFYASVFEIASLKIIIDSFTYDKSQKKPFPASYQVLPLISVSSQYLFQNSSIIGRSYNQWIINWDWIIKGPSYQNALQIFSDSLIKYYVWLELNTEVIVLGFFQKNNEHTPYLGTDDILNSQDTSKLRELILKAFNKSSLYLHIILKIETRFKQIKLYLNLHYIDPKDPQPQSLISSFLTCDTYFKVFFEKNDFVTWNKIFPWNRNQALKSIKADQKILYQQGNLNAIVKLELIYQYLIQPEELFINLSRIIFSLSEKFYNFSNEALTISLLFKYLSTTSKLKKKITIDNIKTFYDEFREALFEDLLSTDNISFDAIGAAILNNVRIIKNAFTNEKCQNFIKPAMKLKNQLQILQDSTILSYRELTKNEQGINLIWINI